MKTKLEGINLRPDERILLKTIVSDPGDEIMAEYEEADTQLRYGDFVILPYWKWKGLEMEEAVMRLLQIREGQGEEETNLLIGRLADGRIIYDGNTPLLRVKKEYIDDITLVFNTHDAIEIDDDHKAIGYTINGIKKVGFFIPRSEF